MFENKELRKPAKVRLENLPGYRAYQESDGKKMSDEEFERICKDFEFRRKYMAAWQNWQMHQS